MTMTTLRTVWDARYGSTAAPTNSTRKQAEVVALGEREGLLSVRGTNDFEAARVWADIARAHDPAYAEAVRTGLPKHRAEGQGFHWSPAFAEAVARIWHGQEVAARLALNEGGFVFHPVSGAHHAGRNHGSAFCTLNFLAGAAPKMLDEGHVGTVAIIDLDAHQGNGTWEWVEHDARLAHFDIAGGSWGVKSDLSRAPYLIADNAEEYWQHLNTLEAWLGLTTPGLVMFQAGADCWERDGVGGIAGVTAEMLAERDAHVLSLLHDWRIPTVIVLGGGYEPESVALHVQTARVALDVAR
jgi:acetoin utilization deacetylase AcuC-like enzyme